jgi:hypothetical protein
MSHDVHCIHENDPSIVVTPEMCDACPYEGHCHVRAMRDEDYIDKICLQEDL